MVLLHDLYIIVVVLLSILGGLHNNYIRFISNNAGALIQIHLGGRCW